MKKENDLLGKSFYHKDTKHFIYHIPMCKDGKCQITWIGNSKGTMYLERTIRGFLQDGTWVLCGSNRTVKVSFEISEERFLEALKLAGEDFNMELKDNINLDDLSKEFTEDVEVLLFLKSTEFQLLEI